MDKRRVSHHHRKIHEQKYLDNFQNHYRQLSLNRRFGGAHLYRDDEYEPSMWSYYKRHTALVLGGLALTGLAIYKFNTHTYGEVRRTLYGSW